MGHASFPSALRPVIISNLCVEVSMEAMKRLNVVTVHPLFKALFPAPSAPLITEGGSCREREPAAFISHVEVEIAQGAGEKISCSEVSAPLQKRDWGLSRL